ncbi:CsgG/HfaB family protein [Spirosoma areae]
MASSLPLPPPKEKIAAAVRKFRYLTDEHKQIRTKPSKTMPQAAIAQDYTSLLIKTLEESGWFTPVEYDNVISLLSERRDTQSNGAPSKVDEKPAPPATVFLEGGILAYETTTLSDEHAIEYFGGNSPKQYQQDRVTVYLRAVSTQSGKILKTLYTTRTIYSQQVNPALFRFVWFKEPYKAETGLTSVIPGELSVMEAIKQAVQGLIIEGVRDGVWLPIDKAATAMAAIINTYEQGKVAMNELDLINPQPDTYLFGVRPRMDAPFITLHPYIGIMRYTGDYTIRDTRNTYGVSAEMYITPIVGVQINAATGTLSSQDAFSVHLTSLEANVMFRPFPFQRWTPIVYGGAGVVSRSRSTPFELFGDKYAQAQFGAGLQFSPNRIIGLRSTLSYNLPFTDALDGKVMGSRNDFYTRITLGLVVHFGRFLRKSTPITFTQVTPQTR